MEEESERKGHAIMISIPFQGHIAPFVSLALKLASSGFIVTFVHLEFVHHALSKSHVEPDIFSEARQSGLDIRYTTIGDGVPLEFDRDVHFEEYWETIVRDFPGHVDEFVAKMIGDDSDDGVRFLVTDTIYEWTAGIAEKYNFVNVSFWTQPALVFSLAYHWDLLEQNGHFPCKANIDEEIKYIPGVDSITTKDLMLYMRESESDGIISKTTRKAFEEVKKADFILHNTVFELESPTILSALNKYQPNYTIGPISFSQNLPTAISRLRSGSDCTHWLASKPPGSVLYVSFGSLVRTSKQVIQEVAHGLLLSRVSFIWVIRPGILADEESNVLPPGYEDEVKDRGLIVPWCDQIEVLSSPAVGGFLTHNGWNSTVESMWCGVPMICYPIGFEQFCNRKLVVDVWKIGIDLCDGGCVNRKEVGEKIKLMMIGGDSWRFREEVSRVKMIMHNALKFGGSSETSFDRFIHDLKSKIFAK